MLEVEYDNEQSLAKYGKSAMEFAQSCNWLGEDVWFAHLVKATEKDIRLLAETKTGIAHCPTSNCRLGTGIAFFSGSFPECVTIMVAVVCRVL